MVGFNNGETGVIAPGPVAVANCDYDPAMSLNEKQANARLIAAAPEMLGEPLSAVSLWGFMLRDSALSSAERDAAERHYNKGKEIINKISA
jgi:hypothetical protein